MSVERCEHGQAASPAPSGIRVRVVSSDSDRHSESVQVRASSCPFSSRPDQPSSESSPQTPPLVAGLSGPYQRASAADLGKAAREAWRNHARCIGRLHWSALEVRDRRECREVKPLLEHLWRHLEDAFNGGRVRPIMSVFPEQAQIGRLRIWNPQLCGYAGYVGREGHILGDPLNVALTQRAIDWGWQPPATRTAFDLLPLLLTDEDGRHHWHEVPSGLAPEIKITHPRFDGFAALGLKWYPVPVVCDMRFETPAANYPVAPFSGWYMGTEIGARNLADARRYNLLPVVARTLGLDTSHDRNLWRDQALVELNRAVLFSFQSAGVRIVDHHTASRNFEQFCENEAVAGRDVFADWAWIVPPISGSATPVFHRPMVSLPEQLPRLVRTGTAH
jgi:nitric-oxide synthase, bacterial